MPTVAGSAPATPPFLGPEQSSGFVLVDPKYRLVQLGIAAESSTSSPAPPAIALYERQDFATIKIGGDAPREALGKLLEVKPPATLGPQASSVLMRYEKGTQVVVVSGAATADEAASIATSTAASLSGADQNALTVPPGFAKMIPKLGGSGVEYQLTYMSGNTMVVLRFAKRPNSDPVELVQPAPAAWIQTVGGRRVQVNAITGNSTIGLSWIEDGFLVSLVSANDLRDSLTLMGSVSPTDAPTWSQLLSDFRSNNWRSQLSRRQNC